MHDLPLLSRGARAGGVLLLSLFSLCAAVPQARTAGAPEGPDEASLMALTAGTLMFTSGVAADTPSIVFSTSAGVPVSAPVSNPVVQAGGTGSSAPLGGLVSVQGKGYMLVAIEATAPVRVWDADHTVLADLFATADEAAFAAASSTAFYTCTGYYSALILHKINATTGADDQTWDLSASFFPTTDKPFASGLAVSPDGTRAYVFYQANDGTPQVTVIDLSGAGSVVTETLLDLASLYAEWPVATGWQPWTTLSSNFIRTFDGARLIIQMQTSIDDTAPNVNNVAAVWTIAGAFDAIVNAPENEAPDGLFQGYTSATFWRYIDNTTSLEEVNIDTEAILHTIDVVGGLGLAQGAYGGYSQLMTLARAIAAVPVATPKAPQTPCVPDAPQGNGGKGNSGCNDGSSGWTSQYSGSYDTVPSHADPVDGELLTNKRSIDFWVEWIHRSTTGSPASFDTYRRAFVELGHLPTYQGGRKQEGLKAIGDVEHGLGNEMGGLETATVTTEHADMDRLVRTLLDGESIKKDEYYVKGATPEGVAANAAPRVFARALIEKADLSSPISASVIATDQIGAVVNEKLYPTFTYKDCGSSMPGAPPDTLETPIFPLYGEKSDYGASSISKGRIPGVYCGTFDLTGHGPAPAPVSSGYTFEALVAALQASVDAHTTDADWGGIIGHADAATLEAMGTVPDSYVSLAQIIGYGDLDAALASGTTPAPDDTAWGFIAFGLGKWYQFFQVYGSNLGGGEASVKPDRTLLDHTNRSDIYVPPNNYVEFYNPVTGRTFWVAGIYVRGPLLDDHINGVVNITCNAMGIMGNADLPIIDAHAVEQHWHENFVARSWSSGAWATTSDYPQWSDGTPKVRSSSFAARQAYTAVQLPTRGLTVGWYPDAPRTIKAWVEAWDRETETKTGVNGHGQIVKYGFDPDVVTSTFRRVDHAEHIFGQVRMTPGQDPENLQVGSCDYDPDKGKYWIGPITRTNEEGVRWNAETDAPGPVIQSTILNVEAQLAWVLEQRNLRLRFGSTFIDVPGPIGAWDTDVGEGVLLTTIEGTGASGFVNRKCIKVRRKFSFATRIVTDTLWDVEQLLN